MAVKIVILFVLLAIVMSVAMVAAFWYFKESKEMDHEMEKEKMKQTEKLFEE